MISALGSAHIYQALLLILVLFLGMTINVEPSNQWSASTYGDIHNISHPFRLTSNQDGSIFDLSCEDNRTVRHFVDGRYYVQSINYSTHQIRLIDDGLQKDNYSSLPHYSSSLGRYNNQSILVIVNCSKPVSSPFYIAFSPCIKGSYSSNTSSNWNLYALLNPNASDVRDFCNISRWTWTDYSGLKEHINSSSYNYELIHSIMADGFTLHYVSLWKKTSFCYFDWYGYFHFHSYFRSRRFLFSYVGVEVCGSKYYQGSVLDDIAFGLLGILQYH
ncbi:hypothetical protein ACJRO7_006244 [Eucalyptus globulus]|uniref:Wall-associated receptor kinase galacturonan-binding domain-containing protein n=1 Tax=Eucalyptus globulus TaxID=34317 RepID=A0ABD3IH70_EUCGL